MVDNKNIISVREADNNIVNMEIYDTLPSTAALAREYAKKGYGDRYVVFSERQKKSHLSGSKTNENDTDYEYGMFMSIILRPSFFASQSVLLSFMASAAMVSALEEHTTKELGIGWVSDVYCEGQRIGGSSIEGKLDSISAFEYIILNFAVTLDPKNFPLRLTDMVRKVFIKENTSVSMIIARHILNKFFRFYADIKTSSRFMNYYQDKFILRGQRIKYLADGKRVTKKVLGVDSKTGYLILDGGKNQKEILVSSANLVSMPKRIRIKKKKHF